MKKILVVSLLSLTLLAAADRRKPNAEDNTADLVLRRGRIYTMDAARSWAESFAVKNGRIVFVGDDSEIAKYIGSRTITLDVGGRMVLPGFIDAHVHPVEAGVDLNRCDLSQAANKDEALKKIRECVAAKPDAEWIIGSGWALPWFPDANPNKKLLDEIIPDKPAYFTAADGHSSWVNSRALELARVTKNTKDPESGRIERDSSGEPTGTLRESASDLVYRLVPRPTLEDRLAGLQAAVKVMNGFGITGFQDASVSVEGSTPEARGAAAVYKEADNRGLLTIRASGALYANPEGSIQKVMDQINTLKKNREQFAGKYFRPNTVKIFADGVIEARTAALLHPYLDKGNEAGELVWQPEKLNPFVELLDNEKFQIHIHAIGDRAIRIALNALEQAAVTNGPRDRRPLIAHLELIDPADIPRFAAIGVVPVFQPLWAYADAYITDLTIPKLGEARSRWIYPMQSIVKTGATMAMGSDWNVSSVNPLDGIEVAVTRLAPDEESKEGKPFISEERMDLPAALAAYTIGSAYAIMMNRDAGSIETGKYADFIVLSQNLFAIPPSQINETKVLLTFLEGKQVHRAAGF